MQKEKEKVQATLETSSNQMTAAEPILLPKISDPILPSTMAKNTDFSDYEVEDEPDDDEE